MKKILRLFAFALIVLTFYCTPVFAGDVSPEFTSEFFPDGKISVPEDLYLQIYRDYNGSSTDVRLWQTLPEDLWKYYYVQNIEYDYDVAFAEKYNCYIDFVQMQVDLALDDGEWHYDPETWDNGYEQDNLPEYLFNFRIHNIYGEARTYWLPSYILCSDYAASYLENPDQEDYLRELIIPGEEEDSYALDLENHTVRVRARYAIKYRNDNMTDEEIEANGGTNESFLYSDWTEEISIGKEGTQVEPELPEKIEAPIVGELLCENAVEDSDGYVYSDWHMYVEYPSSITDAVRYYEFVEDSYPIGTILEYRLFKDGEWTDWMQNEYFDDSRTSGRKYFTIEGLGKEDPVEFRLFIRNEQDESLNSEYSESLICNEANVVEYEPVPDLPEIIENNDPYTFINVVIDYKPGVKVKDVEVKIFSTRDPERKGLTDRTKEFNVNSPDGDTVCGDMTMKFYKTSYTKEEGVEYAYENENLGIYAVRMSPEDTFEEGGIYGFYIGSLTAKDGSDLDTWGSDVITFNGIDCEKAGGGYGNTGNDLLLYSYINSLGEVEVPAQEEVPTSAPTPTPSVEEEISDTLPQEDKCKVCGICPIQPLGICLFIWIAIIIVIIVVVVIIILRKKKNDDKNKKSE